MEQQNSTVINEQKDDISKFLLKNGAPSSIYYIQNFISSEEEEVLLEHIYDAPKPKWTTLSGRRLQNWGGIVGRKSLIPDGDIPEWLDQIIERISQLKGGFPRDKRPNHVLINEYLPGQGILPHTDGPSFFPLISTVSLGSHTFLDFYRHIEACEYDQERNELVGSLFVEPRSLLLISGEAYGLLHGISERRADDFDCENVFNRPNWMAKETLLQRSKRVSLTIRNVPKIGNSLLQMISKR